MKPKIKVLLEKSPSKIQDSYTVKKMVGAVLLSGYGAGKDYYVGTVVSQQQAQELAAFKNIEVTVI